MNPATGTREAPVSALLASAGPDSLPAPEARRRSICRARQVFVKKAAPLPFFLDPHHHAPQLGTMRRRSSIITAWALVGVAGLSLFMPGDAPQSRSGKLPPGVGGAKAGKSSPRSGGVKPLTPAAAEAAVLFWLRSSADHSSPPLAACRALSAASVEKLLRDPTYGWAPLMNYSRAGGLPAHWDETRKALMPFHTALLEHWAEVDFQGAVAKIPPTSSYDEDANLSWVIFKAAAKTDPAMAFQALQNWHGTIQRLPPFWNASHDVMQAWSAVDPDASWQWLASAPPNDSSWTTAAQGYLKGLDHPDWQELLAKAETLPGGVPNETNPRSTMRLEMIRAWGREDPLAALESFDRQSADAIRNPYPGYPAEPARARHANFSFLVSAWMAVDQEVAAKLRTWQPEDFDTDPVFKIIAFNGIWSDTMRQQARDLIRDPKIVAEVDAHMERTRLRFLIPQVCSAVHQQPGENPNFPSK